MNYLGIARAQLSSDEGYRKFPYLDTVGKVTIGVGHNLTDKGVSDVIIAEWFTEDLTDADVLARSLIANFDDLSDARKAVLVNMAFNLGSKLAAFHDTLQAIQEGRWEDAAIDMLASKWAMQVDDRAKRLAEAMRVG